MFLNNLFPRGIDKNDVISKHGMTIQKDSLRFHDYAEYIYSRDRIMVFVVLQLDFIHVRHKHSYW